MTDHNTPIDQAKFNVFARVQIRSGRCLKIDCKNYDDSIGPSIENQNCVDCFKKTMQMFEKA